VEVWVTPFDFRNPEEILFVFVQISEGFGGVGQTKDITDILGDEPRLTVPVSDTNILEAKVSREVKGGGVVVHGV
jgi:hypothetical protein